jgi:Helix-turn-helix.
MMNNLKIFRNHVGYSISEISEYLKIERSIYKDLEEGKRIVPIDIVERLADLYCVDEYGFYENSPKLPTVLKIPKEDMSEVSRAFKVVRSYIQMHRILDQD